MSDFFQRGLVQVEGDGKCIQHDPSQGESLTHEGLERLSHLWLSRRFQAQLDEGEGQGAVGEQAFGRIDRVFSGGPLRFDIG